MIKLYGISTGWPVQYEAFLDGKQVGYLRLSDGRFTVEFPDRGGEVIYSAVTKGQGEFMDDEQDHYLRFSVDAIIRQLRGEKPPSPPDVTYELL